MTGTELIADKVRTNREHKGYTEDHDDGHDRGELIIAATCYLGRAGMQVHFDNVDIETRTEPPGSWPFERESWKPSDDPVRNLVHAGALIAAEIDRLQRARTR